MTQSLKVVSVAYTKLSNGHGFQAADKTAQWLLVTSADLNDAIEGVSEQLSEILGGIWVLAEDSKNLLFKETKAKDNNIVSSQFSGFAGVMSWISEAT